MYARSPGFYRRPLKECWGKDLERIYAAQSGQNFSLRGAIQMEGGASIPSGVHGTDSSIWKARPMNMALDKLVMKNQRIRFDEARSDGKLLMSLLPHTISLRFPTTSISRPFRPSPDKGLVAGPKHGARVTVEPFLRGTTRLQTLSARMSPQFRSGPCLCRLSDE
jgi:hypothetical protein